MVHIRWVALDRVVDVDVMPFFSNWLRKASAAG